MADITRLARFLNGAIRGLDLTSNTLVVSSIKLGAGQTELTETILGKLISLQNGSDVDATYHTHDGRYFTETELGAITDGSAGADLVGATAIRLATTVQSALEALDSDLSTAEGSLSTAEGKIDDLVTLSGVAANAENLGVFTGTTIPDNQTIKQALQALETYSEANRSLIQNFEWQESVLDRLDTPPGSPSSGDRYLVIATATGDWEGEENNIAEWNGSAWEFTAPSVGMYLAVDDESNGLYLFGGASWEKKFFEATTASTGLTKSGFDIQLANAAASNGISITSGAISAVVDNSSIEINASEQLQVKADGIKESMIDFGLGADQVNASSIPVIDAEGIWAAEDVEGVLVSLEERLDESHSYLVEELEDLEGRVDDLEAGSNAVKKTFVAGETFAANTTFAVRMAMNGETDGRVYKADLDASVSDKFYVIGLVYAAEEVSAGSNIDVVMMGEIPSSVAFTASQDEGKPVFLAASGAVSLTAPSTASYAVVRVGMAQLVGASGTAKILVQGIQVVGVN